MTHRYSRMKTIVFWGIVVLWAALIFFMSAHTGTDLDQGNGFTAQVKRWLQQALVPLLGPGNDGASVIGHFSEYALFGVLLFLALFQLRRHREIHELHQRALAEGKPADTEHLNTAAIYERLWLLVLAAVVIASLYGITDEFHQSFVPGRMSDPADWFTDTCGAALGAAVAAVVVWRGRRGRREQGKRSRQAGATGATGTTDATDATREQP